MGTGFAGLRAAFICLSLIGALAGCNTPRGAGFQSEVLAASNAQNAGDAPVRDFRVYPVTRESLPIITRWPAVGARAYPWINRQDQPASLLVAPGDTLQISIWDAEENSLLTAPGQRVTQLQSVAVESDGTIFLPFVGTLRVAGMSPQTARARVEEKLIATVPSAQVQLGVVPGRANTANVVSGARAPGVYPLAGRDVRLTALLAAAGGANPAFQNPRVRLLRGDRVYLTSLDRLFDEPRLDTTIVGGDRVVIEEDDRFFLSLGATGQEARHRFTQDHLSVLDALAIVGGITDERANPQGVLILRNYPRSAVRGDATAGPPLDRMVFTLDLTSADGLFSAGEFAIQPGDLVYATESPVVTARTVFGLIGSTLALSNRLN